MLIIFKGRGVYKVKIKMSFSYTWKMNLKECII